MTDHTNLKMHREKVRVSDKKMLCAILDMQETCCVALHDEPYPYIVPMNFGYEWEDQLIFYFHMAIEGHRIEQIKKEGAKLKHIKTEEEEREEFFALLAWK